MKTGWDSLLRSEENICPSYFSKHGAVEVVVGGGAKSTNEYSKYTSLQCRNFQKDKRPVKRRILSS